MNNRPWAFSCLSPLPSVVFVALLLLPSFSFVRPLNLFGAMAFARWGRI